MSKRGPGNFGGDEARYGGERPEEQGGPAPVKATAAQMAKRKIAQAKTRRPRSESPAVFGAEASNDGNQSFMSPAPASFNFGGNTETPSFGASAQPQGTQPQANGNGAFGQSTPSFGASFGAGSQQPSTSSMFNFSQNQNTPFSAMSQGAQPSTTTTSGSIFGGFGQQSHASNQNGTPAPSTNSQTPSTNIFSGFSAKPQESTNASFSFPTFPPAEKAESTSSSSFTFGQQPSQTPQASSSNIFGGFGQTKQPEPQVSNAGGNSTLFGMAPAAAQAGSGSMFGAAKNSSQPESQAPKAATSASNIFGGSAAGTTPSTSNIFGGSAAGAAPATSNVFGSFGKPAQSAADTTTTTATGAGSGPIFGAIKQSSISNGGSTSNIFGAKSSATEAASSDGGSIFDSVRKVNKMPHDLFTAGQTNSAQPASTNIFGGVSQSTQEKASGSSATAETPKPAPSFSFGQTSSAQADPLPAFGQQSSAQTPKPAGNVFGGFGSTAKPSASTSMFGSASHESATATKPSGTSSQNMFASTNGATEAKTADAAPKSLFDRIDPAKTQSLLGEQNSFSDKQQSNTPPTPAPAASSSLFNFGSSTPAAKAPAAAPTPAPATAVKSAASSNMFGSIANAAAQATSQAPAVAATPARLTSGAKKSATEPSATRLSAAQQESFKHLNRAFLAKVQRQDLAGDWTAWFSYYAAQAAIIHKKPAPDFPSTSAAPTTDAPPATPASNIFSSQANAVSQPPNTAPVPRQRFGAGPADATAAIPPATEKRTKPNETAYPKLPENASSTSKLFAAALDKPKAPEAATPVSTGGFKPSTTSLFANASTNGAASTSGASTTPAFTGFKPSVPTASTSTPAPSTGGFKPTFQASSGTPGNFLSAFGKNAAKAEEEAREKRKLEDYDSEDETLEEWEKRDKEEQEAKRAKFAESAKAAKGFVLSANGADKSGASGPFKLFSTPNPSKTAPSTTSNGVPATVGAKASTSTFGFLSQKTQDNASSAPKTTGLFGAAPSAFSSSTSADASASAPKFSFGAAAASPASGSATPTSGAAGAATDAADGDDGEPSDEPPSEPSSDLSLLLPEERENQEVLFELPVERKSRTYAVETSKDGKKAPVSKGIGKPYLLRSKITGRARLLFKIENGKAVMNYDVVKGGKYAASKKIVSGPFMDHIHSKEPKLTQFQMSFSSEELASSLLKELLQAAE